LAIVEASPTRTQASSLRTAHLLTAALIPLVAVATLCGLLIPTAYRRNPAALTPALQGQDLVTLLGLPVLAVALLASWRGSRRATLLWIGLTGYMFYTYTGAAFGYAFGELTLLYVALFSLSIFALASAAGSIDAAEVQRHFDAATPRRAVAGFLIFIALMLALMEVSQNIQFLATGVLPPGVVTAGGMTYFVYGLDLGLIVPLSVLAAVWLWRRRPSGTILAGFLLVKSTTMGLALLAMNWCMQRAGQPADPNELLGFYALLALGGLGMSVWFVRHCRG
jgi:hypothetical protein